MTDKELRKLSRLELLELLLEQTKENEALKEQLANGTNVAQNTPQTALNSEAVVDPALSAKVDTAIKKLDSVLSAVSRLQTQNTPTVVYASNTQPPVNFVSIPVAQNSQVNDSQLYFRILRYFSTNEELLLYLPQDISNDIKIKLKSFGNFPT